LSSGFLQETICKAFIPVCFRLSLCIVVFRSVRDKKPKSDIGYRSIIGENRPIWGTVTRLAIGILLVSGDFLARPLLVVSAVLGEMSQ
jgi:hypothetical protein